MRANPSDDRNLWTALVADGRPLLKLTAVGLIGAGLFAFFLSATGHFLPHDIAFLGLSADELRAIADERVANFLIHDRVSFGGAILGVGVLYLWLTEFPLQAGLAWAWWTLLLSGLLGFATFLTYLGYGYLDTWHGLATLGLLPVFLGGLWCTLQLVRPLPGLRAAFAGATFRSPRSAYGWGRTLLLVTSACLLLGGAIIMGVGMTSVFVPEDLEYMELCREDLDAISPRLIPLIAHDRAGFGGGVCCCGFTMLLCLLCGQASRGLWQTLAITGLSGFGCAIGVHYPIGYTDWFHLAPAWLGAGLMCAGLGLTYVPMRRGGAEDAVARSVSPAGTA